MIEEHIVKNITDEETYYSIATETGTWFSLDKKYNFKPKKGDKVKVYLHQGFSIRGMEFNDKLLYYKTDEQLEEERQEWLWNNDLEKRERFLKNKKKLDDDFNSLPEIFQQRIERFRKGNNNFRIEFEDYEMFSCKQAIVIAEALRGKTEEEFKKIWDMKYKEQKELIPELSEDHSGNTFGAAMRLAFWYLFNPEIVALEHGALVPLVGCKEYGCTHTKNE